MCSLLLLMAVPAISHAQQPQFRVLAFYSEHTEPDHVEFGEQAVRFLSKLAKKDQFALQTTTNFADMKPATLRQYRLVLWLNDLPSSPQERAAFAQYMDSGGGWLGFHIAGYNDSSTNWPWFVGFLGGAVFASNSWPPLPATLRVEDRTSPVTRGLPSSFVSPANEWYIWNPDPRRNKDVRVLLSLDASNYPLGWKDTLVGGDLPVVWTNTRYRMLYINMGHGDRIFTSPIQNRLFENAILWLCTQNQRESGTRARGNSVMQKAVSFGRLASLRYTNAIAAPHMLRYSRNQDTGP
ncbi:MAG TPA: ThuA domain-containing protein [Acidobacteriaceae bacterium]|nr:ThuA domain-containing protein [Acidobacteriaceae bacterium]